uniref:Uncharacterized protein n=1 Tax=Peronospora matthiolae TaxID=2874970 RepID=A0AAV1UF80_9STRA
MRCASKAAESTSARRRADAETTATDVSSVAEATQSVSPGDAGARHEDTRVFTEYELGVSYSPDTDDGSVSTAIESKPPAKRGMDDALRRSIFLHLMNQMNHRRSEGARDRKSRALLVVSVLLWTPLHSEVPVLLSARRRKSGTAMSCVSLLRRRHGCLLNLSWITCRRRRVIVIEHGCSIRQGSITLTPARKIIALNMNSSSMLSSNIDGNSGNHKRDGPSLLQAWNAYIHNLEDVGRDAWNDKLIKARNKFEKRTPTGARYKLHRLSREKGLPCLSWGDSCPCCVNNSARAPTEACLLTSPWWRVRISTEMYEGIDNLKSLYDRAGKTFSGGPSAAQDVPRRTAQLDQVRQSSVGSGAPKYPRTGDSRATGRGNL